MTLSSKYRWAVLCAALQLTWICEAPTAAASPNTQSLIQAEDDEEEPNEPQVPSGTEEPGYPGESTDPGDYPNGSETPPTNTTRNTEVGVTLPTGMVVPLYSHPSSGEWKRLIDQKILHPNMQIIAVVNPNNGAGDAEEAAYTTGIDSLLTAGIWPIGYVSTKELINKVTNEKRLRTEAEVTAFVDSWATLYRNVPGIFFDDQDNGAALVSHYQKLGDYARSLGYTLTVGNPGTMYTDLGYYKAFDIILVYETTPMPKASEMMERLKGMGIPRERCAIAPYGVSPLDVAAVQAATTYVQYVYVTDRSYDGNPWGALPAAPYLGDLFNALDPTPAP